MDKVTAGSFAATMVFILTTTAIVWRWPDIPGWVLGAMLLLYLIVLALCYIAFGKGKTA